MQNNNKNLVNNNNVIRNILKTNRSIIKNIKDIREFAKDNQKDYENNDTKVIMAITKIHKQILECFKKHQIDKIDFDNNLKYYLSAKKHLNLLKRHIQNDEKYASKMIGAVSSRFYNCKQSYIKLSENINNLQEIKRQLHHSNNL